MRTEPIVAQLLEWFDKHGRNYPWRKKTAPYDILIAEIMLQRTKADQVLPVYKSFIENFPNLDTLEKASSKEINEVFARLGLKWRAERVKKLVRILISNYGSKIPDVREKLISLPSVGEYIADAILCFAYGKDTAVVDSNVCRIIGRVFGLKARGEARRDPKFRQVAQQLVPKGKAKEFNWAIIDLGAMICKPKSPLHASCPIRSYCTYYEQNVKNTPIS